MKILAAVVCAIVVAGCEATRSDRMPSNDKLHSDAVLIRRITDALELMK